MKHLQRDLVDAGIEILVATGHAEYVNRSVVGHQKSAAIEAALSAVGSLESSVVVQAMFESGFVSLDEDHFHIDEMLGLIYGVKMYHRLADVQALHAELMARGATNHFDTGTCYNPWGDNYLSAHQFQLKPDDDDIKVAAAIGTAKDSWRTDVYSKVVVIECQSPTYAIILEPSIHSGELICMSFVRVCKEHTKHPMALKKLFLKDFDITRDHDWSPYSDNNGRILTTLDIHTMSAKPISNHGELEHVMDMISSSLHCIRRDE